MFLLFRTLPTMIELSGKSALLLKKYISIKKLPMRKVESFIKSNHDLSQICKTELT